MVEVGTPIQFVKTETDIRAAIVTKVDETTINLAQVEGHSWKFADGVSDTGLPRWQPIPAPAPPPVV